MGTRLVAWMLCTAVAQAGCAPVGNERADDAAEEHADSGTNTDPKILTLLDFTVYAAGGRRARAVRHEPTLSAIWATLSKLVYPAFRLTFERRAGNGATNSFMFAWSGRGSRSFGENGILPSELVLTAFSPETISPYTKTFAIDEARFLSALADLKTLVFDRTFAQEALEGLALRVAQRPSSLTDADYLQMAKVFYVTIAPAFSDPLKERIQAGLASAGPIGLAAYLLTKGYAGLRRWAIVHQPTLAQTTFVATASLTQLWLLSLDLDPSLYSILGPFICNSGSL